MTEDKTVITIARMTCGTVILVASLVLHVNGTLQGLSLFLIGVPVEHLVKKKQDGSGT